MAKEIQIGCGVKNTDEVKESVERSEVEVVKSKEEDYMIRIGKPAPTFKAPAFYEGKFVEVDLEDYKGKWVLLCFYPGDFTFV